MSELFPRVGALHGNMLPDERESVKAAFQAHSDISPVRILLATDAASEGIDLQNHCNYLIHVEIPWNPNVMEQRNGRIDRHGQKEDTVFIWHPVGKGFSTRAADRFVKPGDVAGDHEYLMRAVLKIDTIREDLGNIYAFLSSSDIPSAISKSPQLLYPRKDDVFSNKFLNNIK